MPTSKKITLFATTDLNFDQRLLRISNSLSLNGFDVLLVGRELKNSPGLITRNFAQKRLKCIFNKGILFYLEFNIRIFFFLYKNVSDILVANDLDTVLGVYYGSKFSKNASLVFDAHEYFTEVPELKNKSFKKNIWKKIEQKYIPLFHKHYTVNESLKSIFKKNLNIDFEVVRNISELENNKKRYKKNKEKYILYQGAINKGRGLEAIIRALPKLEYDLVLAGSGDILPELKLLVKELTLENRVNFMGRVEPSELKSLTEDAYIGINFLENTSLNYYYSLANKFFDYAHAEIPQVCMNFPEYKLINNEVEVAVLIKNLDIAAIVNAFKKLSNDNYYKELVHNCKTLKQRYNWQIEEEKLIAIYNKL